MEQKSAIFDLQFARNESRETCDKAFLCMYVDTLRIDFLARASCPGFMVSFLGRRHSSNAGRRTLEDKPAAARGVAGTLIFAAGTYTHS